MLPRESMKPCGGSAAILMPVQDSHVGFWHVPAAYGFSRFVSSCMTVSVTLILLLDLPAGMSLRVLKLHFYFVERC
jgi:hypothetical protein